MLTKSWQLNQIMKTTFEQNENINKKIEIILKIEIWQNTVTKLQNSLEGFNNRLKHRIFGKPENRSFELLSRRSKTKWIK